MSSVLIFFVGCGFLTAGWAFFYKPEWIMRANRVLRDVVFNDTHVLLERKKKGTFLLLLAFMFFYWGYHRSSYTYNRISDRIVSVDRLLYQAHKHLHSREYSNAVALYRRILSREPGDAEALYGLAAAEFLNHHPEEGNAAWAHAEQSAPGHPNAARMKDLVLRMKDPGAPVPGALSK